MLQLDNKFMTPLNLPNKITLFRIFLVPFVLVFLISPSPASRVIAAAIFGLAALSDWVDGHMARVTDQVTEFGKLLDPIADKLLAAAALVSLVGLGKVPAWMVVIIVCRELAVSGLRAASAEKGVVIPAGTLGKYKTGIEITAILFLILDVRFFFISFNFIGLALLSVSLILSLVSATIYFRESWENAIQPAKE